MKKRIAHRTITSLTSKKRSTLWQEGLSQVLRNYGIPQQLVVLLENLYGKSVSTVRVDTELTEWFKIEINGH